MAFIYTWHAIFLGADGATDQSLVVKEISERLLVSKWAAVQAETWAAKWMRWKFGEQYQLKISRRFAALANLW